MPLITATPYSDLTLPELYSEREKFTTLLSNTPTQSSREPIQDVIAILNTWIGRREREAQRGVAA